MVHQDGKLSSSSVRMAEQLKVWTGQPWAISQCILDDNTAAKQAIQHWAGMKEAKVGMGVAIWWTNGFCSDDGPVGAAAVPNDRNEWWSCCSYPGTGNVRVFDAVVWVIRHRLDVMLGKQGTG